MDKVNEVIEMSEQETPSICCRMGSNNALSIPIKKGCVRLLRYMSGTLE